MRLKPNTLIVVAGPTASGKTALAIQIAKAVDGEIVSADSMQIYRGVDIATAKPTPEELAAVPHHLIGFLPMNRAFSVADYAELARKEINDILSRGKVPVLCGGTGLYIKAIVDNVQYSEAITGDEALRERLRQLAERGQIATQYVDREGRPTMDIDYNPNGSAAAIEGIFSPDGRVFGKMGHSERYGDFVGRNIPGDKHQPLFESGAEYFK